MRVRSGRNNQVGSRDETSVGSGSVTRSFDPEDFDANQTLGFQSRVGQTLLQARDNGHVSITVTTYAGRRYSLENHPENRQWWVAITYSANKVGDKSTMSHKRVDQITVSGEWAKHLRPYGKRAFWKAERRAYDKYSVGDAGELASEYDSAGMPTKVQELIARLEADGWYQVRQKGSHRQYHHWSKSGTVTVAGKPSVEVPPGTLNSILKQAGLKK